MKKISTVTKLIKEKNIKIYVINYLPLKERRTYLKKRLREIGLDKFVSWFIQKPGQYTEKEFSKFNFISQEEWTRRLKFVDGPKKLLKPNSSELNLNLNHLEIYKKVVKRKNSLALILEDDVILEEDFLDRLIKCIQELPRSFDVAYTDSGIYFRWQKRISKLEYFPYNGFLTRTTASYFISFEGAKKFLNMEKASFPHDLDMRYYEKMNKMKVYWLEGYLTYQGSVYGNHYKTVLQAKENPHLTQKLLFSIESRRFDKKNPSKFLILLIDYLIIIPYRVIRIFLKNKKIKFNKFSG